MPIRHDVGTLEGLVGHFESRLQRIQARADRRHAAGTAHPLHNVYVRHASEDLQKVRSLLASLQAPKASLGVQVGNADLVPAQYQTLGEPA